MWWWPIRWKGAAGAGKWAGNPVPRKEGRSPRTGSGRECCECGRFRRLHARLGAPLLKKGRRSVLAMEDVVGGGRTVGEVVLPVPIHVPHALDRRPIARRRDRLHQVARLALVPAAVTAVEAFAHNAFHGGAIGVMSATASALGRRRGSARRRGAKLRRQRYIRVPSSWPEFAHRAGTPRRRGQSMTYPKVAEGETGTSRTFRGPREVASSVRGPRQELLPDLQRAHSHHRRSCFGLRLRKNTRGFYRTRHEWHLSITRRARLYMALSQVPCPLRSPFPRSDIPGDGSKAQKRV